MKAGVLNPLFGSKKFDKYKRTYDKKFESYSELINLAKPFISDPWLDFKEAKDISNRFIAKYNNEILPFAPREVVESVQNFLFYSWTKFANENNQTKALTWIIQAIRKDLWLEKLDWNNIEFHAINEDALKNLYIKNKPAKNTKTKPN